MGAGAMHAEQHDDTGFEDMPNNALNDAPEDVPEDVPNDDTGSDDAPNDTPGSDPDITGRLQRLLVGRDAVLAAVAYAAERFLRGGSFEDTMDDVLGELGAATDVDRAYVFTVEPEAQTWLATQRYEWVRPGVESQLDLELFQGFDMVAGGFQRWTELLPRGSTIEGVCRELPPSECETLVELGIRAIAVAPVTVRDRWWGWVAFETLAERQWTPTEIDALEVAAAVLGACLQQRDANELLQRSEQRAAEAFRRERLAAERLRSLDRLKDTFLTAVSHELRTPLTAIGGLAETLSVHGDRLETDQRRVLLERLRSNTQRLEDLLGELLDLNRLRDGAVPVTLVDLDLGELLSDAIDAAELVLGSRACHLDVEVDRLRTDRALLGRIIAHLLENVGRHTPSDASVWVRAVATAGGVVVQVDDDGPGIPETWRRRVFEPFQHGPDINEHQPGTGIGLNLVGRFATLLGGRAWAEPRDGGGASVRVMLPTTASR